MGNKDFDFDNIGKNTPYRIPDNFFEDMQKKIIDKTTGDKGRQRLHWKATVITIFSAAAIIAGIIFIPSWNRQMPTMNQSAPTGIALRPNTATNSKTDGQTAQAETSKDTSLQKKKNITVKQHEKRNNESAVNDNGTDEEWIEQLSDDDLNSLMALADNDEFLN